MAIDLLQEQARVASTSAEVNSVLAGVRMLLNDGESKAARQVLSELTDKAIGAEGTVGFAAGERRDITGAVLAEYEELRHHDGNWTVTVKNGFNKKGEEIESVYRNIKGGRQKVLDFVSEEMRDLSIQGMARLEVFDPTGQSRGKIRVGEDRTIWGFNENEPLQDEVAAGFRATNLREGVAPEARTQGMIYGRVRLAQGEQKDWWFMAPSREDAAEYGAMVLRRGLPGALVSIEGPVAVGEPPVHPVTDLLSEVGNKVRRLNRLSGEMVIDPMFRAIKTFNAAAKMVGFLTPRDRARSAPAIGVGGLGGAAQAEGKEKVGRTL